MADRIIATNVNIAPLVGGISSGVSINSPTLIRSQINSPTISRPTLNSPKVKNELSFGPSFFSSSTIGSKKLNFSKQGFVGTIFDSRTGGSFVIGANHLDPSPNLSPGSNNISPNRYFSPSHNIVISGPSLNNTPYTDVLDCPSKIGANIDIGGAYESPHANSPFSNNNQTIGINAGQTLFFPPGSSNKIGGGFTKKNAFINVRPSLSPGMSTIGVGINSPTNSPNVGFHVDTGSRFDCPVTITNAAPGSKRNWTRWFGGKKDWVTNPTPGNSPTFGINSSPDTSQNGSPLGYSPGFNVEVTASSLFNCPVHYTAPVTFHSPVTFHASPIFVNGTLTASVFQGYQSDLAIRAITGPDGGGDLTMTCANFSLGSDTLTLNGEQFILGSSSNRALKIDSTSTGLDNLLLVNAANDKVSSSTRITAAGFSTAGSVGIGTTNTPSNILQVVGNANFDDTPNFKEGILFGSPQSTHSNYHLIKPAGGRQGGGERGASIKIQGATIGGGLNFGGDVYIDGGSPAALRTGEATAGNVRIGTERANQIIIGDTNQNGHSPNLNVNSKLIVNAPKTDFNSIVTFSDTPNLPGIKITSDTPNVRTQLGLGTNSGPTFDSLNLAGGGSLIADGIIKTVSSELQAGSFSADASANVVTFGSPMSIVMRSSSPSITMNNTPRMPGINLTGNPVAFRSGVGLGTSDNVSFNTVSLTSLSNTALLVQPLNHSKPRLQVSNTSSPSVINGTFNGSPTFAGPVSFNDTPNVVGLNITGAKSHVRDELQLGTGNSPTFTALKLTAFGGGTNSPKVLFKLSDNSTGLPVFADNAAATSGGLAIGQVYRASGSGSPVAGTLMIRF